VASNAFGNVPFIEVRTTSGQVVDGLTCPAYVGTTTPTPQLPSHITGFTTQPDGSQATYLHRRLDPERRARVPGQVTKAHDHDRRRFRGSSAVVAEPIGDTTNTLHTLLLIELAVTAGALVLAWPAAGGWSASGLRPLEDVERTADSIAAGNLDQRVPGADDTTEVGRLARALNVMLERIEAAFSARVASEARLQESDRHLRQFVADASHELRTPIAAVSAYAELFERGAAQHADDLPRVFTGIRSETARMERLVNDLLTLARFDEGVPLQIVPTELVGCGRSGAHRGTVGPQWPVHVHGLASGRGHGRSHPAAPGDRQPLANVRAHTPEGTATTVHVGQEGNTAEIVGQGHRTGHAQREAARVFERFYRVDAGPGPGHGGSGLGLSIVAAIVAAHGGTVSASGGRDQGMTVTVRIPVIAEVVEPEGAGVAPRARQGGLGLARRAKPVVGRASPMASPGRTEPAGPEPRKWGWRGCGTA
jgi:two-component system OmpR family sensor kinase